MRTIHQLTGILAGVGILSASGADAHAAARYRSTWYFGGACSLKFDANNVPMAGTGPVSTGEGSTVVSDNATGQVLFSTDGNRIYNRNGVSFGIGLGGSATTAQSAVAIKKPGAPGHYDVFASGGGVDSIYVTEVDTSLNGGLGGISVATAAIAGTANTGEALAAVPHPNGRDFWILSPETNGNIATMLVTPAGLGGVNHVNAGVAAADTDLSYYQLTASGDGKRLAMALTYRGALLWDFDPLTGAISNHVRVATGGAEGLPVRNGWYGVQFSPSGKRLYLTALLAQAGVENNDVFQIDLANNNAVTKVGSIVNDVAGAGAYGTGGLALGPDGKIYVSGMQEQYLASIDNPDAAANAVTFSAKSVQMVNGCIPRLGLPTFQSGSLLLADEDHDGDGIIDTLDADADGDGIPNKDELGGDDKSGDSDKDGVPDYKDASIVVCTDVDADGICDVIPTKYDTDGDGIPNHLDLDSDNDGIPDIVENGLKSLDANGDGRIDNTTDTDGDGLADVVDLAPADKHNANPKTATKDTDGDGTFDAYDLDSDGDTLFDIIEAGGVDTNNDGKLDGPFVDGDADGMAKATDKDEGGTPLVLIDSDGDTKPNFQDSDDDGDTILTKDEIADGKLAKVNSDDVDQDGKKNWLDDDADNDGLKDGADGKTPRSDDNNDGIPEYLQPKGATPTDTDGDGIPNDVEIALGTNPNNADSDGDSIKDGDEVGSFTKPLDTDGDGKIDPLDDDDDNDGILTKDEVADGKLPGVNSDDVDRDGKKNWLDTDSDADGIVDGAEGRVDANNNGKPDYLDPAGKTVDPTSSSSSSGATSSGQASAGDPGALEGGACSAAGTAHTATGALWIALGLGLVAVRRRRHG